MSLRNQNWTTFGGEPVTGRTPTQVRVSADTPGLVMNAQQEGFVAHAYKLFCDAIRVSAFPDGYHVQNRRAPDGTEVRMESNLGVHRVFVKIKGGSPVVEVEVMYGAPRFVGASALGSLFVDGDTFVAPGDSLPSASYLFTLPTGGRKPRGLEVRHCTLPEQPGNTTWYDSRTEGRQSKSTLSWWSLYPNGGVYENPQNDRIYSGADSWYLNRGLPTRLYLDGKLLTDFGSVAYLAGAALHIAPGQPPMVRVVTMDHPRGLYKLRECPLTDAGTLSAWTVRSLSIVENDMEGAVKFNASGTSFAFLLQGRGVEVDFAVGSHVFVDGFRGGRISYNVPRRSTVSFNEATNGVVSTEVIGTTPGGLGFTERDYNGSRSSSTTNTYAGFWEHEAFWPVALDYVGDSLSVMQFYEKFRCDGTYLRQQTASDSVASDYRNETDGTTNWTTWVYATAGWAHDVTTEETQVHHTFEVRRFLAGVQTTILTKETQELHLLEVVDAAHDWSAGFEFAPGQTVIDTDNAVTNSTTVFETTYPVVDVRRYTMIAADPRCDYIAILETGFERGQAADGKHQQRLSAIEVMGAAVVAETSRLASTPVNARAETGSATNAAVPPESAWDRTSTYTSSVADLPANALEAHGSGGVYVSARPSDLSGTGGTYSVNTAATDQVADYPVAPTYFTGLGSNGIVSANICSTPKPGKGGVVLSFGAFPGVTPRNPNPTVGLGPTTYDLAYLFPGGYSSTTSPTIMTLMQTSPDLGLVVCAYTDKTNPAKRYDYKNTLAETFAKADTGFTAPYRLWLSSPVIVGNTRKSK